ncbi:carboxylesterase/lipase family protein [Rhodococcus gannanensis]|uniref:Carboxylesterase/lipase family protein n=1 Tax=Rhodococcus gannanensis TaxID=1960308 RepID=A0ABW4P0V3_9NOCA
MTPHSPAAASHRADAPIFETVHGPVRGTTDGAVRSWKGIRYAEAPTGDLRYRAPRSPARWTDVLDCTDFGPCAPQTRIAAIKLGTDARTDEDCLSLNVWAPAEAEGLPVLVWIHGGAYFRGASRQPLYDGRALAAGGAVIVTVNYRIGVFGFVDFSSLDDSVDSNVALRDMVAALEWVRDNISAVGGDPGRVTLFGESAGGGAVTTLMTVPAARGLFHHAIAESSPATSVYNSERGATVARRFLEVLGGSGDPNRLRSASVDELVAASDELFARVPEEYPGTLAFAPIVDGEFLPDYPLDVFRRGEANPVPLLIGTNRDESSLFRLMKSPLMPLDPEVIRSMFSEIAAEHPDVEPPDEPHIESVYAGLGKVGDSLALTRDFAFRLPALWIAEAHSAIAPTWLYRFDYATPMLDVLRIGATHGVELPYVFGNIAHHPKDVTYLLGGLSTGRRISARMRHRWVAFATSGRPEGPDGEPEWASYDVAGRATLVIDKHDRAVPDLDRAVRLAWGDDVIAFT